ncbi:dihydroorotase [Terribacillus sp. DMT04]|uniref:dihydroorotase n=1 Tax=Terribacillus sp. DMT04 TaxID=2850441 RepID=UPI001C2B88BC|nr:dihydroorotase [Terribacillus sp. DMT04]QXE03030.1 dihydroorotase [Terribacillus sp. DMT04]
MAIILTNAKQLTADNSLEDVMVKIEGGVIKEIAPHIETTAGDQLEDLEGQLITAGFVDVHVHLREPGAERKETIETGTKAAARGGFTTVAAMPNLRPAPDCPETLASIQAKNEESGVIRVLQYASITKQQLGREIVDMENMTTAFAFTDDGLGIQSAGMMLETMQRAAKLGIPVVAHCEDDSLVPGGVMHEGTASKRLGLPGINNVSESVHIARDVLLAEAAGCHYHICHVSTKESVRVIRDAKRAGIRVTAEVTPHHLLLTDEDIKSDDGNYKMNPPLRSEADRQALIEGLLDGTIDMIATDHAPHTAEEKNVSMLDASFGIVGSETAFSLLYTQFVETDIFTLRQLIDWLTIKPAEAFKLPYGRFETGAAADLTVLNLQADGLVDPTLFQSKGTNTPFIGWRYTGEPTMTICNGEIVYRKEAVK